MVDALVQLEELKTEVERHQGKHWDHHNCKTEVDIVKASCAPLHPCIVPSHEYWSHSAILLQSCRSADTSVFKGDALRDLEAPPVAVR